MREWLLTLEGLDADLAVRLEPAGSRSVARAWINDDGEEAASIDQP